MTSSEPFYVRVLGKPGFDASVLRRVFAVGAEFDWSAVLVKSDAGRLALVAVEECEPYEAADVGRCHGCDRYELGLSSDSLCFYCREQRDEERSQS